MNCLSQVATAVSTQLSGRQIGQRFPSMSGISFCWGALCTCWRVACIFRHCGLQFCLSIHFFLAQSLKVSQRWGPRATWAFPHDCAQTCSGAKPIKGVWSLCIPRNILELFNAHYGHLILHHFFLWFFVHLSVFPNRYHSLRRAAAMSINCCRCFPTNNLGENVIPTEWALTHIAWKQALRVSFSKEMSDMSNKKSYIGIGFFKSPSHLLSLSETTKPLLLTKKVGLWFLRLPLNQEKGNSSYLHFSELPGHFYSYVLSNLESFKPSRLIFSPPFFLPLLLWDSLL